MNGWKVIKVGLIQQSPPQVLHVEFVEFLSAILEAWPLSGSSAALFDLTHPSHFASLKFIFRVLCLKITSIWVWQRDDFLQRELFSLDVSKVSPAAPIELAVEVVLLFRDRADSHLNLEQLFSHETDTWKNVIFTTSIERLLSKCFPTDHNLVESSALVPLS